MAMVLGLFGFCIVIYLVAVDGYNTWERIEKAKNAIEMIKIETQLRIHEETLSKL